MAGEVEVIKASEGTVNRRRNLIGNGFLLKEKEWLHMSE